MAAKTTTVAKDQKKEAREKKKREKAPLTPVEQLAEVTERAELADDLEVEKDVLEEDVLKLRTENTQLRKQVGLLKKGVDLTEADLTWLHQAKAEVKFDRNFHSGDYFVTVKGHAPGFDRRRVQAATLPEAMRLIRGA